MRRERGSTSPSTSVSWVRGLCSVNACDTIKIMKNLHPARLKSVVWKEGKHYVAQCLNVDVSSFGATKEEALLNLGEALGLYFEDADRAEVPAIERPEIVGSSL